MELNDEKIFSYCFWKGNFFYVFYIIYKKKTRENPHDMIKKNGNYFAALKFCFLSPGASK